MTCPACGKPVHPEDRFCAACGAALAANDVDQTGSITSIGSAGPPTGTGPAAALGTGIHRELPTGAALLVVHRGPAEGSEFLLPADSDIVGVGRSPESEVFLDDVTVSRRHAEFVCAGRDVIVRDLGSTNGTKVNGVAINGDQLLVHGDVIGFGTAQVTFEAS